MERTVTRVAYIYFFFKSNNTIPFSNLTNSSLRFTLFSSSESGIFDISKRKKEKRIKENKPSNNLDAKEDATQGEKSREKEEEREIVKATDRPRPKTTSILSRGQQGHGTRHTLKRMNPYTFQPSPSPSFPPSSFSSSSSPTRGGREIFNSLRDRDPAFFLPLSRSRRIQWVCVSEWVTLWENHTYARGAEERVE